jgi:CBS domain-containing protein
MVTTAARILTKNRIGSLVVVDHDQKPLGVITDSDLVSRVLTKSDLSGTILRVRDVMTPDPVTLPPDAYFYQALLAMVKNQIRQIPIIDGHTLLGIVTLRDLIQSRSTGALTIVDSIESKQTIGGLKKAGQHIDNVLKALIAEKASSQEICEVMTEFYDRLTRKVLEICEKEMAVEGYGLPPAAYTWIAMGSSGRKEQITLTDQDNGLIYDDPEPAAEDAAAEYFSKFAAKVVDGLYQCGFGLCRGNVMATNPQWRKPYQGWLKMINHWIREPYSEMLRNFTIFLDFRPVFGAKELADKLKITVLRQIQDKSIVLHFLAEDDLAHGVPLSVFKNFITAKSKEHKGEIDLKSNALVHIVDCIRIFSVREGVTVTNTFARLKELAEKGILPKDDAEYILASHETLLTFRNRENLRKISQGLKPDNYLDPYSLSKREQTVLKESFQAITKLQDFTGFHFRVEGY